MEQRRKFRKGLLHEPWRTADLLLLLLASTGILLSVLGLLEKHSVIGVSELYAAQITLGLFSIFVIYSVLERRHRIDEIHQTLDVVLSSLELGVVYLKDAGTVDAELESLARSASEHIFAVGSRTTCERYLHEIDRAIEERQVEYRRLLTGSSITDQLLPHLKKHITRPKVRVKRIDKYQYLAMTVSEQCCIFLLPGPTRESYNGIKIFGNLSAFKYSSYFLDIFGDDKSKRIKVANDLQ